MAERPSLASSRSPGALTGRGVSHGGRRRAPRRDDLTCGRMAARQLPSDHQRGSHGPPRPAAGLLSPATSCGGQRVEPVGGHGRRLDSAQRRSTRRRPAPGLRPGLSVGVAADDRRALGLAERAQSRAHRSCGGTRRGHPAQPRRERPRRRLHCEAGRGLVIHGSAAPSPMRPACPSSFACSSASASTGRMSPLCERTSISGSPFGR